MEKEKVCSGGHCGGGDCCGSQSCGGASGCSYGSHSAHGILRLFAVLLVMILIFHLGMQIGELRGETYSNHGGYGMQFERGYKNGPMMQYQQAPVAAPAGDAKQ
jgi:hypothetical protein